MIKLKELLIENKLYGIHHNKDLDGMCSGAILKYKYPNIKLIPFDYGYPMPKSIEPNSSVIMVDVSMPMPMMKKLADGVNGNLIWIDHHQSANNAYKNYEKIDMEVVYDDSIAACEILWKYLFPNKEIPLSVKLIGMYDTWRDNDKDYWNNYILPFQYGMREYNKVVRYAYDISKFPFKIFDSEEEIQNIIEKGKETLFIVDKQNEEILKNSFPMEYLGYNALCVKLQDNQFFQSNLISKIENNFDVLIVIQKSKLGNWKFHFRSRKPNVDCSKLAKYIDVAGGGHKGAAGAETKDLNKFIKLVPKEYITKIKSI